MVKAMQPGSVILDMAVEQGGNCALSEVGKTVTKYNVHIIGQPNIPATVPTDSSALYARNVLDFMKLVFDQEGSFVLPADDDIVAACLMCIGGEIKRKN
jgi:NAD(P) transhydrogenase subunit alpha